eukprot:3885898-Rhodomonas_salina.3
MACGVARDWMLLSLLDDVVARTACGWCSALFDSQFANSLRVSRSQCARVRTDAAGWCQTRYKPVEFDGWQQVGSIRLCWH